MSIIAFNKLQIDSGKPGAIVLRMAIDDGWLSVVKIDESRCHAVDKLKLLIDEGEAQVIIFFTKYNLGIMIIIITAIGNYYDQ